MKNLLFLFPGLLLLVNSCSDPWDTRFEGNIIPADKTVWETIDANPAYNDFKNLLIETGYDSILKRDAVFTVLIPGSESLTQLRDSSLEVKKSVLSFQISNGLIYGREMSQGKKLLSLSGKALLFESIGDKIMVNKDAEVTKEDIRASNGIIHEISKLQFIKPNILEVISSSPQFSYISDFFAENTSRIFDEANSVPVGIDENGLTVYDSAWIQSNPYFTSIGNIGSESEQFAIFLASNTLLDTTEAGELKAGYISRLGGFIIKGNVDPQNLPSYLTGADGTQISLDPASFEFLEASSNGPVFVIKDLSYFQIPKKLLWEVTSISDFDSIRKVKNVEYAAIYDQLTQIKFRDFSVGGGLINAKYEIFSGPLNKDDLKIITIKGTYVTIDINLPDIVPGKYKITFRAKKLTAGGAVFDEYINDDLVYSKLNLNGTPQDWDFFDGGTYNFTKETGNVMTLKLDGSIPNNNQFLFDYLLFEPSN
ncbi:MAG: fasciclin domain-containing protein [Bacteroidales bacterium]|nr:fasciclin domain-containing protein [Bacteroidales bacterium]